MRTVICAALAACCCVSAAAENIVLPKRGVCAHRGASSTHPENTIPAFREAIRLGAAQIEFDVYLSKDGKLPVIHDSTVDRTTDGTGPVPSFTMAELKKLDAGSWKGEQFKGTRIPTLTEALAVLPRNIWLNVHLKGGKDLGRKVAEEIVRQKRAHQAFLACGHAAADGAREVRPDILICNMERQGNSSAYVDDTIKRGCQFIQLAGRVCSPEDMKKLKDAGVRVNYFGTNDAKTLKKLFAAGVEFPLVDKLPEMMEAARQAGVVE